MIVGGRRSPTPADGIGLLEEHAIKLRLVNAEQLGDGVLLSYEVIHDGQAKVLG
jgi:2,5-diamino-6-(ribosylamino)-4(3H)-pyrimidinone 5'-phosphate reductase